MNIERAKGAVSTLWLINPTDSQIRFTVEFLALTTATGQVRDFHGTIHFAELDPVRSSVQVGINARSIDTGDPTRDAHLRSADFLDVERFPTITFNSRRIEAKGGPHYEVVGDLTVHGITCEVRLLVTYRGVSTDFIGKRRAEFVARTTVSPKDFKMNWNHDWVAGWVPVGDHVTITIQLEAIQTDI